MPDWKACAEAQASLFACKKALGLMPYQCYPTKGYGGGCDDPEHAYKRCLATAADPRDARVLYDASAPRQARVEANLRIQKKLRKIDVPCQP